VSAVLPGRRASSGAAYLLPVGLAAGAAGVAAAENPLVGAGIGSLAFLTYLPWLGLFVALTAASIANRWGIDAGGITLRIAQAILLPFAARSFLLTNPRLRPRWKLAEWVLVVFIGLQFLTSYFNAVHFKLSFSVGVIEGAGAVTFLIVFLSVCTPDRLRKAARVFLAAGAIGAGVGVLALMAYLAARTSVGIDFRYKPVLGGAPAVKGLAYEHDLFGSTCAAISMVFFVLMREGSTLFSRKWTSRYFTIAVLGMIVSQARGAWLGFGAVFVLYFVFRRRRGIKRVPRMVRTAMTLVLVSLVGLGFFYTANSRSENSVPSPVTQVAATTLVKLGDIANLNSGTGAGRLRRWSGAIHQTLDMSPLIGLGTNSYGQRNTHPSPYTYPYEAPGYLESLYVRTFYDSGMAGLLLMGLFLALVLWPRKELQTSPGDLAPTARGLVFGGLVLAAAYLVTDSTLLIWPWILFGLIRAAQSLAVRQARELRMVGNGSMEAPAMANGHSATPNGSGLRATPSLTGGNGSLVGPDWTVATTRFGRLQPPA
jgi:hypothetical protein